MASSARARVANDETYALHQLTIEYGQHLIESRQQQGPCLHKMPPAWTPFRPYLAEALDYITPGCPNECIVDGIVVACILGRDSGDRTYLDSESWLRTWKAGASLVLVQAPDFNARTIDTIGTNYALIVLSPTRPFNKTTGGPNSILTSMCSDADFGHLKLHRYQDSVPPALASYFQSTWGAEYGFHGFQASTPVAEAPWSIGAARVLLEHLAEAELGDYAYSNSVQVFGFLQGQRLDWHTDGEGELGGIIAILNLGGDAVFKIPLVHGSIVFLHGSSFSKYFEHSLETLGPLTFQVVIRAIDQQKHDELLRSNGSVHGNGNGWTPALETLLVQLHDSGMTYVDIRRTNAPLSRWTVTALSTAYKRIASNSRQPWTQDELDQLWELRRHRRPPLSYAEIERLNRGRRTEKAYREQMIFLVLMVMILVHLLNGKESRGRAVTQ
ncbi:hypothetical protein DV738_g2055, partial [Chaetothyriales sp. CBS 135597]